jgi:uncharacterized damage-inducible protein DinB
MTATLSDRPDASEHAPYFARYVVQVPDGDIVSTLRSAGEELIAAFQAIPESKGGYQYAEGKWSVRTVMGHIIDAERIFSYRALRVARGDATPLPGFEENSYAETANSDARTVADLANEMAAVRASTVRLLESFPDEAWTRRGVASNAEVSTRALAWITAGHALHHLRVLRERYGI